MIQIARQRTALKRSNFSRPIRLALKEGLINKNSTVFDYGCGYGDDIRHLVNLGIECIGWDPVHKPEAICSSADVVNLGYVINVIEDAAERASVLQNAWALAQRLLIVSARLTGELCNLCLESFGFMSRVGHPLEQAPDRRLV